VKALTIWQPWASLIMVAAKPYEFRPKSYLRYVGAPAIGERIVIHAGVRPVKPAEIEDLLSRLDTEDHTTGLIPAIARQVLERLPSGRKVPGAAAGLRARYRGPRQAAQRRRAVRRRRRRQRSPGG